MMRLQLPPWNRWWQTNLPLRAIISGRFFKICLKILESNKAARLEGPGPHWEEKPIYFNFFKIYFWCRPFLKTLLNSLQHCFCFLIFFFFGLELCGVLAPQLRIELAAPAIGRQSLSHIFLIDLVSGHFPMSTVSVSLQVGGLIGGG